MMPVDQGPEAVEGPQRLAPPYASRKFEAMLETRGVAILDVLRGSAPESRRLLLGPHGGEKVSFVVAVAHNPSGDNPVDREEAVLARAQELLPARTARSLPKVLERIEVYTSLEGLLMTAVPGLRVSGRRWTSVRARQLLAAMPRWLVALWSDTTTGYAQVDLGVAEVRTVLAQHENSPRLEPAMDAIRRARLRLAEYSVPQVLTHGCLCPRHVTVVEDGLGVDDWGLGAFAGDPLRDLGRFAVHVASARLPEVLAGRSAFAGELRQCVSEVLAYTPVPPHLWREVLVLAQLELAMESLERADPNGMHLLSRAVRLCGALTRTR
jgi:hypothetical protein